MTFVTTVEVGADSQDRCAHTSVGDLMSRSRPRPVASRGS